MKLRNCCFLFGVAFICFSTGSCKQLLPELSRGSLKIRIKEQNNAQILGFGPDASLETAYFRIDGESDTGTKVKSVSRDTVCTLGKIPAGKWNFQVFSYNILGNPLKSSTFSAVLDGNDRCATIILQEVEGIGVFRVSCYWKKDDWENAQFSADIVGRAGVSVPSTITHNAEGACLYSSVASGGYSVTLTLRLQDRLVAEYVTPVTIKAGMTTQGSVHFENETKGKALAASK